MLSGYPGTSGEEAERAELAATLGALAELALLGAGDADRLFPNSMEEAHAADEMEWRVVL